MATMTSTGTSSSSAFCIAASSQKFWIRLAAQSVVLVTIETFAAITGSSLAHCIYLESGIPLSFAFTTCVLCSIFLLNEASPPGRQLPPQRSPRVGLPVPQSPPRRLSAWVSYLEGDLTQSLCCCITCWVPVSQCHCVWPHT